MSTGARLDSCIERMVSGKLETGTVERAVGKLRAQYRNKEGRSTTDLLTSCEILGNSVKAEVFLGLEEGDQWLPRRIQRLVRRSTVLKR